MHHSPFLGSKRPESTDRTRNTLSPSIQPFNIRCPSCKTPSPSIEDIRLVQKNQMMGHTDQAHRAPWERYASLHPPAYDDEHATELFIVRQDAARRRRNTLKASGSSSAGLAAATTMTRLVRFHQFFEKPG
jgi:hypothetical protein